MVLGVLAEFGEPSDAPEHVLIELNLLDDAELTDRYAEEIPVVLINGVQHAYWRVDAARLRAALAAASA